MITINVKINTQNEAIDLVKKASLLECDADFTNGRCFVDAKSILGVLSADFSNECKIIILADKIDEQIQNFLDSIKENVIEVEVANEKS